MSPGAEASMFRPSPMECKRGGTHKPQPRRWPFKGTYCPNCGERDTARGGKP
jgi:hypothetical protein